MCLCNLNEISARVGEYRRSHRAHRDRWLGEFNTCRTKSIVFCLDILNAKRCERNTVLDQRSLEGFRSRMFIRLKDRGIEPTAFSRQLPTLDDVFFKILDDDKEPRYANAH